LIKDFAKEFSRVEMKQVGFRQEPLVWEESVLVEENYVAPG
jgi:hypothetical protein